MKVIFTCGGTAGHIYPALAVADLIRARQQAEIIFVGAKGRMETELVPRGGYEIRTIEVSGFSRSKSISGVKHNIGALRKVYRSRKEAGRIVSEFKPDVVIGTGGYASYPIIREAVRRGIPTAIHESNATPGLTTKVLSQKVDKVMVAFEDSRAEYSKPERVAVTGTPVRSGFVGCDKEGCKAELGLETLPLVVSFWGSLGASVMNAEMAKCMAYESADGSFHHIHATGKGNLDKFVEDMKKAGAKPAENKHLDVREYIYDMPKVMAAADLIVCRAGASTLAEVTAAAVPAVLVPSPYVTDNHQEKNARLLEKGGAAIVMLEKEATGENLFTVMSGLLRDGEKLRKMSAAAGRLSVEDAAQRIYGIIMELCSAG